ncbi:hypothetical protein [uncultured Bacteroides sp.]|uniref:hypothetical protein n=1 Tax=uncultured Bacteroides sp. TaxID=162156 RepID=UPI00280C2DFF|nr:hypothetical protein [uncultured Bacteroides sp.]
MKLKEILAGLCLAVIVLMLNACADSKLEKLVEELGKECPIQMGTVGEVTSFMLEDGNLVVDYEIDESFINLEALDNNPELLKDNAVLMCKNATGGLQTVLSLLVEEDAGWVLKYKGKSTGKELSISLDAKEIKEAMESTEEDRNPMELLKQQVEITNVQFPMKVDQGMTITKLTIEGWYVVYNVEIDESLYSIEAIASSLTEVKENIVAELDKTDPAIQSFLEACKRANKGVAYKYIGKDSGKSCMVKIPASEL